MSVINNDSNVSILQFMSVFMWVDILSSLVIYWRPVMMSTYTDEAVEPISTWWVESNYV